MNKKKLRNLHLYVGFLASVPFLIISITGIILSIREILITLDPTFKTQFKPVFKSIKHLHTFEFLGISGMTLSCIWGLCLTVLVISGIIMGWKEIKKRA